jgi:hypothetical protein
VRQLLVTANVLPSSPIIVTLMMEALSSLQTSILTRSTLRNITEDAIRHNFNFIGFHYCTFGTGGSFFEAKTAES